MASWLSFLFALAVLVFVLLVLTHISTQLLHSTLESTSTATELSELPADTAIGGGSGSSSGDSIEPHSSSSDDRDDSSPPALSTAALWANVVATQLLFGLILAAIVWYTGVPVAAFGVAADYGSVTSVAAGLGVGVVFFSLSELSTRGAVRLGAEPPTALRELLAAETPAGWAVLLFVVLPVIAIFEELLFRGAMIGVLSVGFDVPVWLLVVGSSVAFGLGHSAQGRIGMLVTGVLGLGLAGVFVWTESLFVVIVAHYVINAAEFIVHEGP